MLKLSQMPQNKVVIWLVRHGETFANLNKICQGQMGGELTKPGHTQTQKLGLRLACQKFDFTYCSDLNRCIQTLENIKKQSQIKDNFTENKVKLDARLREKHAGIMQDKPLITAQKEAKAAGLPIRDYKPESGECWKDVNARAKDFLLSEFIPTWFNQTSENNNEEEQKNQDFSQVKNLNILVVAHGGFIMEFINVIKKQISQDYQDVFCNNSKNTCINQFIIVQNPSDGQICFSIGKINDADHLLKSEITLKKEFGPKIKNQKQVMQVKQIGNKGKVAQSGINKVNLICPMHAGPSKVYSAPVAKVVNKKK